MRPGDWARIKEDRWSFEKPLETSRRTLVFGHRLVSNAWNRGFTARCVEATLVQGLRAGEQEKLDSLLRQDHKLSVAFEKFRVRPDSIWSRP